MNIRELILKLEALALQEGGIGLEAEVMLLDGENGQGTLRSLNFGPVVRTIRLADYSATDDCDGKVGQRVAVLGFGCY